MLLKDLFGHRYERDFLMTVVSGVQSVAEKISKFTLSSGGHKSSEAGMCVMEAVSYIAGEEFSAHPACACHVITEFMISFNDILPDNAARDRWIKPLVLSIVDSRVLRADGSEDEDILVKRALVAGNAALRWFIPLELDIVARSFASYADSVWSVSSAKIVVETAATLRALPEQTTFEDLIAAADAANDTLTPITELNYLPVPMGSISVDRAGIAAVAVSCVRVDLCDLAVYANCSDFAGISEVASRADLASRIDISGFSDMVTHADKINEARVKVVLEMLAV